MKKNNTVYLGLCADILHIGHINIIKKASKYGTVIIGLLTDSAIKSYKKKPPIMTYSERKKIIESIKYISKVIPQNTLSYRNNLEKIKPNYVVHGDDWKSGIQKNTRDEVIECLKKWKGKVVEPKYTKNISSSMIKKKIKLYYHK